MPPPAPDAKGPGTGIPGHSPNDSTPDEPGTDGTAPVSQGSGVQHRCTQRQPCGEVLDRLRAADRGRDLDDVSPDHPALAQLRVTAARFAELHNFGQSQRDEATS